MMVIIVVLMYVTVHVCNGYVIGSGAGIADDVG